MVAAMLGAALFASAGVQAQQKFITIGTGGVTGVYYPTGGAICRLVNTKRKQHGFRCSVESTDGSIDNINNIRAGELQFGIVQSDWQYHAYNGTSRFQSQGKFENLRAVFSVYPEVVTIVARNDSGVNNLSDIKGKRMNIGSPGSGARGTWEVIEQAFGWNRSDLKLASELKSDQTGQAMCDGKIDAYFWLVGHPSALTEESLENCDSHLVNATGPEIDKLIADHAYYVATELPANMYNNENAIKTFGAGATFVSSASVPEEIVYLLVKSVFENFGTFKQLHPAFANLQESAMISDSLSAPIHKGALKYYKERGWM